MELLVSLKPMRKFKPIELESQEVSVELDIRGLKQELKEKFVPLLAVELEELGYSVRQVRVGSLSEGNEIERLLDLLDYLNVDVMVVRPRTQNVEILGEILDEASMYGIRVVWEFGYGPIKTPDDVFDTANKLAPHRFNIAMHVAKEKSLKSFLKKYILVSGFVKAIYYSNKKEGVQGLPIMDGVIDYLKVTKFLQMLKYEERIVLNYSPRHYEKYLADRSLLSTFINSLSGGLPDKDLRRKLEKLVEEALRGYNE